ncbi:MAG: ribulose-phosphate 3-epimerase [Desulfurivibrionaceae bacterium]
MDIDRLNSQKILAPSILSANFARMEEEIEQVTEAGADTIHVDVMDGHFVPNITIGPPVIASIKKISRLPLDVHLMISDPDRHIEAFAEAGADWITVHVEAAAHLHRTIQKIRDMDKKAGAVLNPATSLTTLDYILEDLDLVMLMSVNPGFGGQSFISSSLDKIRELKKMITEKGLATGIEIDGGVSEKTISRISEAGANIFVAGSAVFKGNYQDRISALKNIW